MKQVNERYRLSNLYLSEFQFFNGEYDITFNIVDIDTEKMTVTVAITNLGKISVIKYDLLRDEKDNLYFRYGLYQNQIMLDDFDQVVEE